MSTPVGVRAAAAALGVQPSTVSRNLKRWPDLNRGAAARPLVDVAELRRRRAGEINPAKSGSHAGAAFDAPKGTAPDAASDPETETAPGGATGSAAPPAAPAPTPYSQAAAANAAIKARLGQIKLEQALGVVADRKGMLDQAVAAGAELRAHMAAGRYELAARLAAMTDPRAIEQALEDRDNGVLNAVCDAFARDLDLDAGEDAAA